MRRTLIAPLALLAACWGSEPPAADPLEQRELTLADLVGTWEGTVMAEGSDAPLAYIELLASPVPDGWSFTVVSAANPARSSTAPSRVVSMGGDSIVVEADPFPSVLRPGETLSTHSIYRLRDGTLEGTIHASYSDGEEVMLRAAARRRP
jgi:hypothetical protein